MGYGQTGAYGALAYKQDAGSAGTFGNKINKLTGKSFRFAVRLDQGVGWNENTGDDYVWPEPLVSALPVFDALNQPRQIVLDERTGQFWEIGTRNGPNGSGISRSYRDKETDYGGTEIPAIIKFKEHRARHEHQKLENIEDHYYLRPQDPGEQGASGHDSQGFRLGFEVTISKLKDGELTTNTVITRDIPVTGDIVHDEKVEARRIQGKFETTTSEFRLVQVESYHINKGKSASRTEKNMSEHTYQSEMRLPSTWASRGSNLILDRSTGDDFSGSTFGSASGPDGNPSSAMSFSPSDGISRTLSSITGNFSIMFWLANGSSFPIKPIIYGDVEIRITEALGVYSLVFDDTVETFTQQLNWNSVDWVAIKVDRKGTSLRVSENGVLLQTFVMSGIRTYGTDLDIMSSVSGDMFDFKIFRSFVSDEANAYYYNDIINNNGNKLLPSSL